MAELLELSPQQLSRVSESDLLAYADITRRRLNDIDRDNDIPDIDDLSESERQDYLESQRAILERQLSNINAELTNEQISLEQWERLCSEVVSASILLILLFNHGGWASLQTSANAVSIIRQASDDIRSQVRAIISTADKVASGEYTLGQFLDTSRRRGASVFVSYHLNDVVRRISQDNHNEGIRRLTSKEPCPDCPGYQVLNWSPIETIVPVASYCVCGGECKCEIETRFNPQLALQQLTGGSITQRVSRYLTAMDYVESSFLEKYGLG